LDNDEVPTNRPIPPYLPSVFDNRALESTIRVTKDGSSNREAIRPSKILQAAIGGNNRRQPIHVAIIQN
jgi:hypothetical protein